VEGKGGPKGKGAGKEKGRSPPADDSRRDEGGNSFLAFFLCLIYNIS